MNEEPRDAGALAAIRAEMLAAGGGSKSGFKSGACEGRASVPAGWPQGVPWPRPGRAHQVQGRGARAFAAVLAGLLPPDGAVIWIRPQQARGRLDGFGAAGLFDPERLLIVQTASEEDGLWAMEESLRAGAAGLVALETRRAPDLTAGRRLQLAAEAAASEPAQRPIGLTLVDPDDLEAARAGARGTAAGVVAKGAGGAAETRWRITPIAPEGAAEGGAAVWRWRLEKNKRGVVGAWRVVLRATEIARAARMDASWGAREADATAPDRLALDAAAWRGAVAAA